MERILALLGSLAIMVSPGAVPGQDELPRVLIIGDRWIKNL